MMSTSLSFVLAGLLVISCASAVVRGGAPYNPCDPKYGTLTTVPITVTTTPGSSYWTEIYNHGSLGFISFALNGSCQGDSHLAGLSPVTAYIRNDGIPWEDPFTYDYLLNFNDFFFAEEWFPLPSPYVAAIFGYEGTCNVELTAQYCECLPGNIGPFCRTTISKWGETEAPSKAWSFYCIPQDKENITVSDYIININTTTEDAVLMMYTRWGGVPTPTENEGEFFVLPSQRQFNVTIPYPRYEYHHYNDTRCYWVGIFNPSPTTIPFNITYNVTECAYNEENNCVGNLTKVRFDQEVTLEVNSNWTYILFDPSEAPRGATAFDFNLYSSDNNLTLFTRRDGPPTLYVHDYSHGPFGRNNTIANEKIIEVRHPLFGLDRNTKWWVGVYSPSDKKESFSVNSTIIYCDRCSSNGVCTLTNSSYPTCVCKAGYAGRDCSSEITGLQVGNNLNLAVPGYQTNYHSFKAPTVGADSTLFVTVRQVVNAGAQFLLLDGSVPSSYNFYYRSSQNQFTVAITEPVLVANGEWYFAVSDMTGSNVTYSIHISLAEIPLPTTTSTTTTHLATTSTTSTSTTGRLPTTTTTTGNVVTTSTTGEATHTVYRLDSGAAAGIAIAMLVAGVVIGLGVAYFIARRRMGYASLRGNANFD